MKRYQPIIAFLLIVLAGYLIQPHTPWWSLAVIALVPVLFFDLRPAKSFLTAFLAGFLLWSLMAFLQHSANQGILTERIGGMLGGVPGIAVLFLTGLIGGLTASLGALTGSLGKFLLKK